MRNKLRRPLAFLLSAVMIVTMSGTPVHAVADRGQPETGLCEHHTAHTDDCGYTEETPGTPCGHEHTEDCYIEVTECVHEHTPECYPAETEDSVSDSEATPANAEKREPENCPHICNKESGCITETLNCQHEHDGDCGYTESTPGTPCTFVCEICNPQDSGEADKEPETGIIKQEHCSCLTLCTEGQINPDCLVCGAEDSGLSDCKGEAVEENAADVEENADQPEDTGVCKHHQEHDNACGYQPTSEDGEGSPCTYECRICPIEALIAALPEQVAEDNADDARGQLDHILDLYGELTEDEQEQVDLSRVTELQGALDTANMPTPVEECDHKWVKNSGEFSEPANDVITVTCMCENCNQRIEIGTLTLINNNQTITYGQTLQPLEVKVTGIQVNVPSWRNERIPTDMTTSSAPFTPQTPYVGTYTCTYRGQFALGEMFVPKPDGNGSMVNPNCVSLGQYEVSFTLTVNPLNLSDSSVKATLNEGVGAVYNGSQHGITASDVTVTIEVLY